MNRRRFLGLVTGALLGASSIYRLGQQLVPARPSETVLTLNQLLRGVYAGKIEHLLPSKVQLFDRDDSDWIPKETPPPVFVTHARIERGSLKIEYCEPERTQDEEVWGLA